MALKPEGLEYDIRYRLKLQAWKDKVDDAIVNSNLNAKEINSLYDYLGL